MVTISKDILRDVHSILERDPSKVPNYLVFQTSSLPSPWIGPSTVRVPSLKMEDRGRTSGSFSCLEEVELEILGVVVNVLAAVKADLDLSPS